MVSDGCPNSFLICVSYAGVLTKLDIIDQLEVILGLPFVKFAHMRPFAFSLRAFHLFVRELFFALRPN